MTVAVGLDEPRVYELTLVRMTLLSLTCRLWLSVTISLWR